MFGNACAVYQAAWYCLPSGSCTSDPRPGRAHPGQSALKLGKNAPLTAGLSLRAALAPRPASGVDSALVTRVHEPCGWPLSVTLCLYGEWGRGWEGLCGVCRSVRPPRSEARERRVS